MWIVRGFIMYIDVTNYTDRVPLSMDVKEVLEVAYVSRIMSKNFRKEGQPEKERIAGVTGMELEKVCTTLFLTESLCSTVRL